MVMTSAELLMAEPSAFGFEMNVEIQKYKNYRIFIKSQ
jgi:hypothetical protein